MKKDSYKKKDFYKQGAKLKNKKTEGDLGNEDEGKPDIKSPSYFNEELWLLNHVKKDVSGVLKIVFSWYDLDGLKTNFWKCLQSAITNHNSAYDESYRSVNLMKFYESVLLLMETLNDINSANVKKKKKKKGKNKPFLKSLTTEQETVIKTFCTTYTFLYAKIELWDCLDSAISNDEFYKVGLDRSYLLLLYQNIMCLIEAAFLMCPKTETLAANMEGVNVDKNEMDILDNIKYFFLNNPLSEVQTIIDEFYKAWVHNAAEYAETNEHSEKLMFKDYLLEYMENLHKLAGIVEKGND